MITNSNLLLNIYVKRAGVIPYTFDRRGKPYFLLAKDRRTGELGDFGGGSKNGENALQTAKREFEEESKGIFNKEYRNLSSYTDKVSVCDKDMAIIFLYLPEKWLRNTNHFKRLTDREDEIIDIVWVDWGQFYSLIYSRKAKGMIMWKKIRQFLKKIEAIRAENQCINFAERVFA